MTRTRKPKRGRPPEAVENVRSRRIVTYVTRAEFRALAVVADREGRSLSATVHEILVAAVDASEPKSTAKR